MAQVKKYFFQNRLTQNMRIEIYANEKDLAKSILSAHVKNPDNFKLLNNF